MMLSMGDDLGLFRFAVLLALLALCLGALGCGSSEPSAAEIRLAHAEEIRQEHEAARDAREERENRKTEAELKAGDYVSCGGEVFASKASLCTFAHNVQEAYYTEVQVGRGKPIGFQPSAEQDYRVLCSGTVPHKCTSFKDDAPGIEPLPSGVIFFSP
jgi:hypothetical protein